MAFINELVSKEDIEKYGLAELHQHYSELAQNGYALRTGLDGNQSWMVDREREIWFMRVGVGTIDSDPIMPTGEDYYILHYKGKNIEVLMRRNRKEGSTKISDNPFRVCWEILFINPESLEDISTQEIIDIIAEAELVDNYGGSRKFFQNPDIQVKYVGEAH